MNYELIDSYYENQIPNIRDCEAGDFETFFDNHFSNNNEDEDIRIEGVVTFDVNVEDVSFSDERGSDEATDKYLSNFQYSQVKIYINDIKVSIEESEYQGLINLITNDINNLFQR
jgi:hypothetical protein